MTLCSQVVLSVLVVFYPFIIIICRLYYAFKSVVPFVQLHHSSPGFGIDYTWTCRFVRFPQVFREKKGCFSSVVVVIIFPLPSFSHVMPFCVTIASRLLRFLTEVIYSCIVHFLFFFVITFFVFHVIYLRIPVRVTYLIIR